ncbi:hypothetical protein IEQ34_017347 [Dendrobium chrysotoxum]|uniref:Uncharacterized protein n=1 Tax=Dendrobium chrysotoxum TaxID=161865 RepID=A0AAV7GB80_DENCH|nr:hypothetical protein IEQ34_017347 [Dendrobium chrysotoxum]
MASLSMPSDLSLGQGNFRGTQVRSKKKKKKKKKKKRREGGKKLLLDHRRSSARLPRDAGILPDFQVTSEFCPTSK